MLHYINYRMKITLQDSRTIIGTFMARNGSENYITAMNVGLTFAVINNYSYF